VSVIDPLTASSVSTPVVSGIAIARSTATSLASASWSTVRERGSSSPPSTTRRAESSAARSRARHVRSTTISARSSLRTSMLPFVAATARAGAGSKCLVSVSVTEYVPLTAEDVT